MGKFNNADEVPQKQQPIKPTKLPMTTGKLEVTIKINELPNDVQTNKDNWKIFQLDCDGRVVSVTVKPKYGRSLRMLLPTIPSGWQLSAARWVNQPLMALCYQSQISKSLRENRRNPNLKQDSESSYKSWAGN